MKINADNRKILLQKMTEIQIALKTVKLMFSIMAIDISDNDKHDIKALDKSLGWISNLKADVKRTGKK